MKPVFVIVALALVAVGCGAVMGVLLAPSPAQEGASTAHADYTVVSRRLGRLEARLEEVAEVVQGLAARREQPLAASAPTLKGAAGAAPSGGHPPPAARQPAEDLTNRTSKQLQLEALDLSRNRKDHEGALRRWRVLAERDLPEAERLSALLGMGRALEGLGRLDTAAETYQRVIDGAPAGSAHEHFGRLHMGGLKFWEGDYHASLAAADSVIGSRDAKQLQVMNARWLRATSLIKLDDVSGARRELESMLEDYAGQEGMDPLLRQYRDQLRRLD